MTTPIDIRDQLKQFLLYTTPSGKVSVEIFFHNENVRLSQKKMAELFGVHVATINEHIKNIYETGELKTDATVRNFLIVQTEGNREVSRTIEFYSLDMIISVWYRVNSTQATQFRIRATDKLKEYMIKGFVMDDERMKNGQYFSKDYFRELLERVRSIRSSERRIYQQITDIFAECSIDYDPRSEITKTFFATIQNKFHFAITAQTAAEIIYHHADASKPSMWLQTWKSSPDGRILKSDTTIAKNYLQESDIKKLERTIASFFDYIERLIEQQQTFTMKELSESVNAFLSFNNYKILTDKWNISKEQADEKAHTEYEIYNKNQPIHSDFDSYLKTLPSIEQTT